jgi:hypothetical protein
MKQIIPKIAAIASSVRQSTNSSRIAAPVNINQIIDDLSVCLCELVAYFGEPSMREQVAKHTAEMIPNRVRYFREIGRYPGGECSNSPQSAESSDIRKAESRRHPANRSDVAPGQCLEFTGLRNAARPASYPYRDKCL